MPKFKLGEIVYLIVRRENVPGMICTCTVYPGGVSYSVTWADNDSSTHYEMELTDTFTPDYL
jgi:hypothetical protein